MQLLLRRCALPLARAPRACTGCVSLLHGALLASPQRLQGGVIIAVDSRASQGSYICELTMLLARFLLPPLAAVTC